MDRERPRAPVEPSAAPTPRRAYRIHVEGAPPPSLRDAYHRMMRMPWAQVLALIVLLYMSLNALFAALFVLVGGVQGARPGSFFDAFFFSVQTMGTIGYGAMYPVSMLANSLVAAESVVGLVVTALCTGLVFVRFSQTRARVAFSRRATISPMDGIPTLMVRLGNERANHIFDVTLRLAIVRTTLTAEGVTIYRTLDLAPVRAYTPTLTRSFTVMHQIVPGSPLHGDTPASLERGEVELTVSLTGTDDVSLQPVHARYTFDASEILWGARPADILSEREDGDMVLDLRRFHDVEPTRRTDSFPYPPG